MLLLNFIPISVILVGKWIAPIDANSIFLEEMKKSCGPIELKQCWCLTENPWESDVTSENPIYKSNTKNINILTEDKIHNYIMKELPKKLNLSGRSLRGIDTNAFHNLANVKNLNLSNNNINEIPEFMFSNLTNLKRLSLSSNDIRSTKNVFAGLSNLESLDLSYNPLTSILDDNCFFGLTESCDILIKGVNGIHTISSNAFGNKSSVPVKDNTKKDIIDKVSKSKSIQSRSAPLQSDYQFNDGISSDMFRAQICIKENIVQRLDILKIDENLTSDCSQVEFRFRNLRLEGLGISKFENGWYRLQRDNQVPSTLSAIDLSGNNIVRVTSDVVNILPSYITWLNLAENKIERLEKGTFQHRHIFSLELNNNLISEIEDNAFNMPKLDQLFISENRLKNTQFAATLPSNLISLHLDSNEITEISANSFSNLNNLRYLNLKSNKITTVQSESLLGATSLSQLILSGNKITAIEPDAFKDLKILFQLLIANNDISNLEKGAFVGLENIQQLNIENNKLTKIGNQTFDLPKLESLDVSNNDITVIEKGALKKLSNLEKLDISMNPIKRLENGALFGLSKIRKVNVLVTGTPIEVIQGGLFDDV